ncbi:hypothetical protein JKP88DRAFT_157431 [Tribonema minus]|uniref:Uncharacterized protein n=1 Tax=Tribonema minus TaxID=303371 RepID=A0A835Z0Q4_9STRA|nr:hypothetical protein JKP88DRAFT_157431 [Tribonema minus]
MACAFSSVSAFSAVLNWAPSAEACLIQYGLGTGGRFTTAAEVAGGACKFTALNLRPSQTYRARVVTARHGVVVAQGEFVTRSRSDSDIAAMYESLRGDGGELDATDLDEEAHDALIDALGAVAKEGDVVHTAITVHGSVRHARATVALPGGEVVARPGDHLLMPFARRGDPCSVTIKSASGDGMLFEYCPDDDTVIVAGVRHQVGDRFVCFGQSAMIARGSIVVAFTNSVTATYPHSATLASKATTQGTTYFNAVSMSSATFTGQQTLGQTGKTVQSHYVYHPSNGTTQEIARHISSVASNQQDGTYSLGLSHADGASTFIDPVIQCARDETRFTSSDATTTVNSSFTKAGLSFDNADAALYLGANKEFRLKFTAGTGGTNYLSIDALVNGSYVTKSSFSN